MNNDFNELFEERMKTIDTRLKLNRLIALNLQLFNAIVDYAQTNHIPLTFNPRIMNLIRKIEQTDNDTVYSRRKVTPKRNRRRSNKARCRNYRGVGHYCRRKRPKICRKPTKPSMQSLQLMS